MDSACIERRLKLSHRVDLWSRRTSTNRHLSPLAAMSPTEKVTQYMNEYDVVPKVEEAINKAVLKKSTNPLAEVGLALLAGDSVPEVPRPLSLPKQVAKAGGVRAWNAQPTIAQQIKMLDAACTATTVAEALVEARGTHPRPDANLHPHPHRHHHHPTLQPDLRPNPHPNPHPNLRPHALGKEYPPV